MKIIKQIGAIFLAGIFMVSSAGVIMFESSCTCSGIQEISLYVSPETCEDNFHVHHEHDEKGEDHKTEEHNCHECTSHTNDCGCSDPLVKFFKLKNQLIDEELKFVKVQALDVLIVYTTIQWKIPELEDSNEDSYYIDPPPRIQSSLDFLIQIHQLKIPNLA